jgi:hypothetical protein
MNAPLYLARSRYINGGSFYGTGYGIYWSSTVSNLEFARRLGFYLDGITPEDNEYRSAGFSLRCILR